MSVLVTSSTFVKRQVPRGALESYPKSLLEMGPTFVHANMRFDHVNDVEANDHFHD